MVLDIKKIRSDFPILSREVNARPLVYLDNGATAQKPRQVIDKISRFYSELNGNVHRGVHYLSNRSTEEYEAARETVRNFIGAGSCEEIIFTSGATAALNLVAYSFSERYIGAGDNVVISEMEHHSNIVPWQIVCQRKGAEIRVLPFDDEGRLEVEKLSGLIDDRTRIVCVTQASNILGTRPDLGTVIDIAHSAGVPVLVDGCQGIVHGGVDVRELDCDFYTFSGHKFYGPTGTGVLYGKRELLEELPPFMGGGDMVSTVTFTKTVYAELPLKFEAGTANYVDAVAMAEAIRYMEQFDPAEVEAYERNVMEVAAESISRIGGVRIYGSHPDKCPILSFAAEGVHSTDIAMILDKMGIAVRSGTHCAEPVIGHFGITGMCRASFAVYNTEDEAVAFVRGVEKALAMLR